MEAVYIVEGARTAFGTFGGAFKDVSDIDLGVTASREAMKRSHISPEQIDHVFFGNVIHTNQSSSYLARYIGLKSGVPHGAPALSVNRLCGSGLQAIVSGAQQIMLGDGRTALVGGAENMSQSPHVLRDTRFGSKLQAPKIDDMLWATLTDHHAGCGMGVTAENLAEKYNISREEQDEFSVRSHELAANARENGRFDQEIVPVSLKVRKKEVVVDKDEHIKGDTTVEKLGKLNAAFKKEGTVTAGNASGINDGAAAVTLASETFIKERNIKPLAKIVSWGIAGVDPAYMGIGPVPASKIALQKASLTIQDIDLIEINEAFAAQYLAVEKELGLDRQKANVNGGAIALGHPVGASGARIVYSLAKELKLQNKKYGLASLCIGGGQGISLIIESI
ncbi:thiolase family protein [Alkalihalobacterium sp. APHAB7]|uniref:thiolase family protein n=1 Tax=Alkalihalobacterium sp. APHAB7 TaxID=3402081 RepID=UPI003AAC0298